MLSGLFFTSLLSTNFGTNSKSWRLFADIIVDVGITLEMLAPLASKHFLSLICLASVFKTMCGIAAGAANGEVVVHWAQNNNLAEVLAKVRGGNPYFHVSIHISQDTHLLPPSLFVFPSHISCFGSGRGSTYSRVIIRFGLWSLVCSFCQCQSKESLECLYHINGHPSFI